MSTDCPELPPLDLERPARSLLDLPADVRTVAVDGLEQMKDGCESLAHTAEEAGEVIERSCAGAVHGGAALGLELIAAMQANMNAGFAFAAELAEARTLPDMIELSSTFAARRLEAAVAQGKALWASGQRLMSDAARPFADSLSAHLDRPASS